MLAAFIIRLQCLLPISGWNHSTQKRTRTSPLSKATWPSASVLTYFAVPPTAVNSCSHFKPDCPLVNRILFPPTYSRSPLLQFSLSWIFIGLLDHSLHWLTCNSSRFKNNAGHVINLSSLLRTPISLFLFIVRLLGGFDCAHCLPFTFSPLSPSCSPTRSPGHCSPK